VQYLFTPYHRYIYCLQQLIKHGNWSSISIVIKVVMLSFIIAKTLFSSFVAGKDKLTNKMILLPSRYPYRLKLPADYTSMFVNKLNTSTTISSV